MRRERGQDIVYASLNLVWGFSCARFSGSIGRRRNSENASIFRSHDVLRVRVDLRAGPNSDHDRTGSRRRSLCDEPTATSRQPSLA
jgi:hypothetical protein